MLLLMTSTESTEAESERASSMHCSLIKFERGQSTSKNRKYVHLLERAAFWKKRNTAN